MVTVASAGYAGVELALTMLMNGDCSQRAEPLTQGKDCVRLVDANAV